MKESIQRKTSLIAQGSFKDVFTSEGAHTVKN
jgi:hypothetical protein